MYCIFTTLTKGEQCSSGCGYRLKHDYDEPPRHNCPAAKPRLDDMTKQLLPSITELAKNYKEERAKWIEAGKPVRTDERILEIYTQKCEPSDFRQSNRCGISECFVKPKGTLFNKLAWGTTKCPYERSPFWSEETDPNNLRNATQEEIDAFEEEEELKLDEKLKQEMLVQEENQETTVDNPPPPPPPKKKGCGCGG